MAGLKVGKSLILPRTDNIKDPEAKRVIQGILKLLQGMNNVYYSDLINHEDRIDTLENP